MAHQPPATEGDGRTLLCADDPRATFPHLSAEQLAGEECVVCWRPNPDVPIPHLGGQVFACGTPPREGSQPCGSARVQPG